MVDEGFSFNPILQEPFWFIAFPMVRAKQPLQTNEPKRLQMNKFFLFFFSFFWEILGRNRVEMRIKTYNGEAMGLNMGTH
jgi:hypothetical protein